MLFRTVSWLVTFLPTSPAFNERDGRSSGITIRALTNIYNVWLPLAAQSVRPYLAGPPAVPSQSAVARI
jgi:hypothetical protein